MIRAFFKICFLVTFICGCQSILKDEFNALTATSPRIEGKLAYLSTPYVTAGDRVYMVGHQDGSFPDLGWHIKGIRNGLFK